MMTYPLSIGQILKHAAQIHGSKQLHTQIPTGKIYTTNNTQLNKRVNQLANAITEFGIQPGDIIGTLATNTFQHLELCYAIPLTGAIIHPLNVRLSPVQLIKIIHEANDKFLFVDGMLYDQYAKLSQHADTKRTVIYNEMPVLNDSQILYDYEELISDVESDYESDIQDENWGMALCHTSGTDGEPKGILYTHRSMFLHTLAANQADVFGFTEADVVMPLVPIYHAMAWGIPYAAMFVGAELVLANSKDTQIIDLIAETEVTVAAGVPTIWKKLLPEMTKRKQDVNSLKRIIVGGEPMPASLIEIFETEFKIEVRHAWGMTEMSPTGTVSTIRKAHENLSQSEKHSIKAMQGQPISGVQLRLVDKNHDEIAWDGNTTGELQVKSPWTASSYYNSQAKIDNVTEDGWLETGDLATINQDGYVKIVDRKKSLIRSGGESISSTALEAAIITHPLVIDAAVIGVPDEKWGERPIAVVVLSEKIDTNISEIMKKHLKDNFPRFWIPDKFYIVEKIPKTGVGKTDKKAILQSVL